MQLRYAAWYVASFAPAAFIPWICGTDDSMTLPVKSMEFIVMLPARALSARTWSPMIGEAVPALSASGASSLQAAKSATVGTSPSAVRVAAGETRRVRARVTTTLDCRAMSYSFQEHPQKGNESRHPYRVVTRQEPASLVVELQEPRHPPHLLTGLSRASLRLGFQPPLRTVRLGALVEARCDASRGPGVPCLGCLMKTRRHRSPLSPPQTRCEAS